MLPGNSYAVLLEWKIPNEVPCCLCEIQIAVWGRESGGYLYDEMDRKTLGRKFNVAYRERIMKVDVWFYKDSNHGIALVPFTEENKQDLWDRACSYAAQIIDEARRKGYVVIKSQKNMAYEIRAHIFMYDWGERSHSNPIDIELYTTTWAAPHDWAGIIGDAIGLLPC